VAAVKVPMVYKSNVVNEGNFGDLGLTSLRVMLNCITHVQRHDAAGNPIELQKVQRVCRLSAAEYATQFNITEPAAYIALAAAADKLLEKSFRILRPTGSILKIAICSQVEYIEKEGHIYIEFSDRILPHLVKLKDQYTMYSLAEIAGFNSEFTVRLYELVQQWKTQGYIKLKIKDLRHILGCTNRLLKYYDFKRFAFEHAVNEINKHYDVNLKFNEVEETKKGKAFTEILFTFRKIEREQRYDTVKQKMRTQVGKYKKIKTKKSPHEITSTHTEQIESPLNNVLSREHIIHQLEHLTAPETDNPSQKESSIPITPQPATLNPTPQKKKRFFGIF
jgi:plasmid replication initiation protein